MTQRHKHWFWPLSGDMGADGRFHLFVAEMRENGPTYLSFTEPIATWVGDDRPRHHADRRPPPGDRLVELRSTGSRSSPTTTYTYLFAHCHRQFGWDPFPFVDPPVYVHDWDCADRMTVARIPKGQFDQPLAYWNGSTWGTDACGGGQHRARRPPGQRQPDVPRQRQVGRDHQGRRLVRQPRSRSTSPTDRKGPYHNVRTIATPAKCDGCNTYFASLLPYPGSDGSWLIGISNNVFGPIDMSRYHPTFFATPPILASQSSQRRLGGRAPKLGGSEHGGVAHVTSGDFQYTELLPLGPDPTPYRLLTTEGVSTFDTPEGTFLKVEPEAITPADRRGDARHRPLPAARPPRTSWRTSSTTPRRSANDRFVALDLLKNAAIAAGGVLPMCQDTGTAIVKGKKGQFVFTGGGDEAAIAARRPARRTSRATCATARWRRSRCTTRSTPAPTSRPRSRSPPPTATPTSSCSWPRAAAAPTRATCSRRPRRCSTRPRCCRGSSTRCRRSARPPARRTTSPS